MSAEQRENEYCDAVYELLIEDPEQSMTLAALGTLIPKPSKKASSKRILAADGCFDTESDCISHVVFVAAAPSQFRGNSSNSYLPPNQNPPSLFPLILPLSSKPSTKALSCELSVLRVVQI